MESTSPRKGSPDGARRSCAPEDHLETLVERRACKLRPALTVKAVVLLALAVRHRRRRWRRHRRGRRRRGRAWPRAFGAPVDPPPPSLDPSLADRPRWALTIHRVR